MTEQIEQKKRTLQDWTIYYFLKIPLLLLVCTTRKGQHAGHGFLLPNGSPKEVSSTSDSSQKSHTPFCKFPYSTCTYSYVNRRYIPESTNWLLLLYTGRTRLAVICGPYRPMWPFLHLSVFPWINGPKNGVSISIL